MDTGFLLRLHLSTFVPLRIAELRQAGGPSEQDFDRVQGYAIEFASSEALLYRQKGKTGELAGKLVEAVAILAFCPGGVTLFQTHFDANTQPRT